MMAQPATGRGRVRLARAHPTLQVGWHLHLCDSLPATTDRWPWGAVHPRAPVSPSGSPARSRDADAADEVARQWELFQATGLECRFINSHHHLHAHPAWSTARCSMWSALGSGAGFRLGRPRALSGLKVVFPSLGRCSNSIYLAIDGGSCHAWRSHRYALGRSVPRLSAEGSARHCRFTLPDGFHEFLFHPRTRYLSRFANASSN